MAGDSMRRKHVPKPDDPKPDDPKTFTQAEIDKLVEDRLKREREKFSDYDELKKKAEAHDKAVADKQTAEERLEARIKAAEDKATEAEKKVAEADARALRSEVAQAKGLTPAQAKRLSGSTREELEADADDLLTSFKPADDDGDGKSGGTGGGGGGPASRPREDLRGGGDPTVSATETDPAKLASSVPRH